jgi:LysR family cys regulon transcriptional activator
MKLRTLECFCEIAVNGFNFSRAAKALNATQPALSRQIQLLEQELGFPVFERRNNRAFKLTAAGEAAFQRALKIVGETRELRQIKDDLRDLTGTLVIATTEFNARYVLLPAIQKFRAAHPKVSFSIVSADPAAAAHMVATGKADLGLCSATAEMTNELWSTKCFEIERAIVVPRGHPLTRVKRLSLKQLAAYPLIVYDSRLSGGSRVLGAFEEAGIKVQIALSATTADAIKAYVAAGIGIGIIQASAFDRIKDDGIRALDGSGLFKPTSVFLLLRKGSLPRAFVREFISLMAPKANVFKSGESPDLGS